MAGPPVSGFILHANIDVKWNFYVFAAAVCAGIAVSVAPQRKDAQRSESAVALIHG
ncbi:MAG: hypothetical protein ACRYHA_27955 [Janthinobacterium lividum]